MDMLRISLSNNFAARDRSEMGRYDLPWARSLEVLEPSIALRHSSTITVVEWVVVV